MKPKVRAMLDQIDAMLVEMTDESRELWAILTALRGPDAGDYGEKAKFTIPVRRAAFPRTAAAVRASMTLADFEVYGVAPEKAMSYSPSEDYQHFQGHVYEAQQALGMFP
jgi:hypothetical protein